MSGAEGCKNEWYSRIYLLNITRLQMQLDGNFRPHTSARAQIKRPARLSLLPALFSDRLAAPLRVL